MQETVRLGHLLHLRSRISDRDELAAYFYSAHRLLRALKEILFEDVRFKRASRLTRNNKQRLRYIDLMLERFHLRGIGGVKHMQGREASDPAEGHAQDLGTKTRSTHAEQEHVLKAAGLHFFCQLRQLVVLSKLLVDDIEPAQPVGFVAAAPERGIALP